jgi:uncharacterized membrane protein (UPF0127 family)
MLLDRLRFARRPATRLKGLLGRRSLEQGEGLGFKERSIHMLFMRMSLDIVFCDAGMRVVKVNQRLAPWRFAGCASARYVLEIGPGECERLGIRTGERLSFEPPLT